MTRAGVPAKYHAMTILSWLTVRADTPETRDAAGIARRVAAGLAPRAGMMLFGATGRGKTGLAAGVVREWMKDPSCRAGIRWIGWASYCDMLNEVRAAGESDRGIVRADATAPALVIDDLGADEVESGFRTRVLLDILEARAGRPTIITSMYHIDEVARRMGDHIAGRIVELCELVPIGGDDLRRGRAA